MTDNFFEPSVDVFVSYSHGAIEGNSNSTLKQWSQKLASDLREELNYSDREPKLRLFLDESERLDESVARSGSITEQLKSKSGRAATFVVLMTDQYLKSTWCTQEREWWFSNNDPDPFNVGSRHFICKVFPTRNKWPAEFIDETTGEATDIGFEFFDPDTVSAKADTVRPYCWRGGIADQDHYNKELLRLTKELGMRIDDVRDLCEERREAAKLQARLSRGSGEMIFLHARESAADQFELVRKQLQDEDFAVFPNEPVPILDNRSVAPEFLKQIQHSDALLLLTPEPSEEIQDPGSAFDADMVVIGRTSRFLAAANDGRSNLPCAVLNTVGEDIKSMPRVKNAKNLGMHWLEAADKGWPNDMRDWLAIQGEYM